MTRWGVGNLYTRRQKALLLQKIKEEEKPRPRIAPHQQNKVSIKFLDVIKEDDIAHKLTSAFVYTLYTKAEASILS